MYKLKSEIIEQVQSFHQQLSALYLSIYEKVDSEDVKPLVSELYELENSRIEYLERHRLVAKQMDCWLCSPSDRLSQKISDCFKEIKIELQVSKWDLLKIELHFDQCLIKLYTILASEDALNESLMSIFHYMLKKTKREESDIIEMLTNCGANPITM